MLNKYLEGKKGVGIAEAKQEHKQQHKEHNCNNAGKAAGAAKGAAGAAQTLATALADSATGTLVQRQFFRMGFFFVFDFVSMNEEE